METAVGEIITPETTRSPEEGQRIAKIADAVQRNVATGVRVSTQMGGLAFADYGQVMEFSKLMSMAQGAVPPHCRGNPGVCLAIVTQAIEWRMSPFACANKSYFVNDRVGWESQMIHAVIEARAPLESRLRCEYVGKGMDRRCRVIGRLRGEQEPFVYLSEPLSRLLPPKNENGVRRGSPLWDKKPDLQLWYNASRDWARMYCPEVILGIYSEDELDEALISRSSPVEVASPKLLDRLPGAMAGAGFSPDAVKNGMAKEEVEIIDPVAEAAAAVREEAKGELLAAQQGDDSPPEAQAIPEQDGSPQAASESATNPEPEAEKAGGAKSVRGRRGKGAAAAEAAAPEPEPEPKAAEPEPKNEKQYRVHFRTWLDLLDDPEAGRLRWKEERKLRNRANVSPEHREELQAELETKCRQLEEKRQ